MGLLMASAQEQANVSIPTNPLLQLEQKAPVSIHTKQITPNKNWLEANLTEMQQAGNELVQIYSKQSKLGTHTYYEQFFLGKSILGAYVKVDQFVDGTNWIQTNLVNTKEAQVQEAERHTHWVYENQMLVPVNISYDEHMQIVKTPAGADFFTRDTRRFCHHDDTMVFGRVFLPDPLSSAGVIYGQDNIWLHFRDSNVAIINNERKQVSFNATLVGDSFELKNQFVQIVDFAAPFNGITRSATPNFDFLRASQDFKNVNAFYHINATQNYIQELGYELVQYPIRVDASSGTGDNSFFRYLPDTSLNFGLGGVPDAEDADVVVHEYTHAISYDINPYITLATERGSIEEAMCDVMAAIRSKKHTTFNWRRLFNYDGPNPVATGYIAFWSGRNGNSAKTYQNRIGSLYPDSEIWSSCLLDISESIGVDTLIDLMLASISLLTPSSTMPQAAQAIIKSDSLLYNAAHVLTLGWFFTQRQFGDFPIGIRSSAKQIDKPYQLLQSYGFATGNQPMILNFSQAVPAQISIYNHAGVLQQQFQTNEDTTQISPEQFKSGVYFMHITIHGQTYHHRFIKY
jgi:hypothetical protein